jgi:hypothetical protein
MSEVPNSKREPRRSTKVTKSIGTKEFFVVFEFFVVEELRFPISFGIWDFGFGISI